MVSSTVVVKWIVYPYHQEVASSIPDWYMPVLLVTIFHPDFKAKSLGPLVQNFVSLTSSLTPELVELMPSANKQIHCYFSLIKCENPKCIGFSHFINKK